MVSPDKNSMTLNNYDPLMVSPEKNSMTRYDYDPLMVSPDKNSMTRYDYDPLMVSPDRNSMTLYNYDPLMVSPDQNSMTPYKYDPLMVRPDKNSMALHIKFYHASFLSIKASSGPYQHCVHSALGWVGKTNTQTNENTKTNKQTNAVVLEVLPIAKFGHFEIISVSGVANRDTSTGKAALL